MQEDISGEIGAAAGDDFFTKEEEEDRDGF